MNSETSHGCVLKFRGRSEFECTSFRCGLWGGGGSGE